MALGACLSASLTSKTYLGLCLDLTHVVDYSLFELNSCLRTFKDKIYKFKLVLIPY